MSERSRAKRDGFRKYLGGSLFIYFSLCFLCGFNCKGKEKHKYLDYGAVNFKPLSYPAHLSVTAASRTSAFQRDFRFTKKQSSVKTIYIHNRKRSLKETYVNFFIVMYLYQMFSVFTRTVVHKKSF